MFVITKMKFPKINESNDKQVDETNCNTNNIGENTMEINMEWIILEIMTLNLWLRKTMILMQFRIIG